MMKASKYLKLMFVLTLLTLCLPWFTYNVKVMGYRYGFVFFEMVFAPSWLAYHLSVLAQKKQHCDRLR